MTQATNFQGVAYNEAETSMFADVARTQFGVDGTGVTVGVLSDSVNQFAGGLADSVKTGDLPKKADGTAAVNVLLDDTGKVSATDGSPAVPPRGQVKSSARPLVAGHASPAPGRGPTR